MSKWPVFICYRQSDGKAVARRIHDMLHGHTVTSVDPESGATVSYELDVYLDQAAPAAGDWGEIHEPYLKRARAFIVVCTPGAKLKEGNGDWVHQEIDWWLENNQSAPVLIDALGEEARYIPDAIESRWPNAQRIRVVEDEWSRLDENELKIEEARVQERLIGGITSTAEHYLRRELEEKEKQSRTLQKALDKQKVLSKNLKKSVIAIAFLATIASYFAVHYNISSNLAEASKNESDRVAHNLTLNRVSNVWRNEPLLAKHILEKSPYLNNDLIDFTYEYLDKNSNRIIQKHKSDVTSVKAIAINNKRSLIALSGSIYTDDTSKRVIEIINYKTKKQIYTFEIIEGSILKFSSSGKYLAFGGGGSGFTVFDMDKAAPLKEISTYSPINTLSFLDESSVIAAGGSDGQLYIFDIEKEAFLYTKTLFDTGITAIKFPRKKYWLSSNWIAVGSDKGEVVLLNYLTNLSKVVANHKRKINVIDFYYTKSTYRNAHLASIDESGNVNIWDVIGEVTVKEIKINSFPKNGKISLFGNLLATIIPLKDPRGPDLTSPEIDLSVGLHIWDIETGGKYLTLQTKVPKIESFDFSEDGNVIATWSNNRNLIIWNPVPPEFNVFEGHFSYIDDITFCGNNGPIATSSRSSKLKLWDFTSGDILEKYEIKTSSLHSLATVLPIACDGNNNILAIGNTEGYSFVKTNNETNYEYQYGVWLYDYQNKEIVKSLPQHYDRILDIDFSKNGDFLATGCSTGIIRIWKKTDEEYKLLHEFDGHEGRPVLKIKLADSGSKLLSIGKGEKVKLWQISPLKELESYGSLLKSAYAIDISPDEQMIAFADLTGNIWIKNTNRPYTSIKLEGHTDTVLTLKFSPDNRTLASGGEDGKVILWDTKTGFERAKLIDDENHIVSLCFKPDGKSLVAGGSRGKMWVWKIDH